MSVEKEFRQISAELNYRDVRAKVHWSDEDSCWVGESTNTPNDIVAFEADTYIDIFPRFHEAIDAMYKFAEQEGLPVSITSDKPVTTGTSA